jgi:hypothetical protein
VAALHRQGQRAIPLDHLPGHPAGYRRPRLHHGPPCVRHGIPQVGDTLINFIHLILIDIYFWLK